MKNNQENYFEKCMKTLKELKRDYPNSGIGKHITLAMFDYNDTFGITDREFSFALEKYQAELELNTVSDKDIENVLLETDKIFEDFESKGIKSLDDDWENED